MTREEATEMVRRYGAAIADERRADAAEYGMALVEALMKVSRSPVRPRTRRD